MSLDPYGNEHNHEGLQLDTACPACDLLPLQQPPRNDTPAAYPTDYQRLCVRRAAETLAEVAQNLANAFGKGATEPLLDTCQAIQAIANGLTVAGKPGQPWPR